MVDRVANVTGSLSCRVGRLTGVVNTADWLTVPREDMMS